MSLATRFAETGYVLIQSAITPGDREFLLGYVLATLGRKSSVKGDAQVPGTPCVYGDFAMETLLEKVLPSLEHRLELKLFPTYSYVRIYKDGDFLPKHIDRPACEISGTVCLGYAPDVPPWPIWVEHNSRSVPVSLNAGDMLVYRGTELPHWRDAFRGQYLAQAFLHYVDQNGPNQAWKFDKRASLRTAVLRSA